MKNKLLLKSLVVILLLSLSGYSFKLQNQPKLKYIFLFIGDGMGVNQVYISDNYLKLTENKNLSFLSFPYFALTTTHCLDSAKITDSAAGGTAIACGRKTQSGVIGMNQKSGEHYSSIAQILKNHGWKIGILSTVSLNHATPASFYGHQTSRSKYNELVKDLIASNFDYFAGGGIQTSYSKNVDSTRNVLFNNISSSGYQVIFDSAKFTEAIKQKDGRRLYLCDTSNLINHEEYKWIIDSKPNTSLPHFVQMGIDFLKNDKGFFIMAEGGKIDWSCHGNDAATTIQEVIDFDKSVQIAYNFYKQHPDETLIIVTADHETGGLSWGCDACKYDAPISELRRQTISEDNLTLLLKKTKNNEQQHVIESKFGIMPKIDFAQPIAPDVLSNAVIDSLNRKACICWTSGTHTGMPVGTFAIGVGAEKFSGAIDNTDIVKLILETLEIAKSN